MSRNAELCKARDQYRVLFVVWVLVAAMAVCNAGVFYNNLTDGGGYGGYAEVDVDGRPIDFGGARAREMYHHLEDLASEIYDDNVARDSFFQTNFAHGGDWTDEAKGKLYDLQFHLSQKTYIYQQRLREFKELCIAKVESTKSSFVRFCERVWFQITTVTASVTGYGSTDSERENVELRVLLVQLHQKHEFLQKQLHGSDEEGYMVMMQQQGVTEALERENAQLHARIKSLLARTECDGGGSGRSAAVAEYELKQCTRALDHCLGHLGHSGFDVDSHYERHSEHEDVVSYEEESYDEVSYEEVSYQEEEEQLPADFDVDEGVCDFFMAVADACIVEKGEEHCGQTFADVRANCPQFQ